VVAMRKRRGQHISRSILLSFLALIILTACISQPAPDRSLTTDRSDPDKNGATPSVPASARATIRPVEVVTNQSHLQSYPNGMMRLTIMTGPFAICSFRVSYGMVEPSNSPGIIPVTADVKGIASWQWKVEGKAPTGKWPLAVTAAYVNGAKTTATVQVIITLPPINLVSERSELTVPRKARATLTILTAPFLNCTATLTYRTDKTKTFKGTSDAKGILSWTWHIDGTIPAGTYPITVIGTTGHGEQSSAIFNVNIY
jgi:hypothetical protein